MSGGRFLACEFDDADAPVTKTFENGQSLVFSCEFHGRPRATKDFDLWIEASPDNARRVVASTRFAFPV